MELSRFAETQPHAAYCAFTHGLSSRWNTIVNVAWSLRCIVVVVVVA